MGDLATLKPRSLVSSLLGRFQFLQRAGLTYGGKRDMYEVCGYARELTAKDFRDRYSRDGIAARVVDCYPKATWREGAFLQEDDDPKKTTPFEDVWETFEARLGVWAMFERADKLARLSTYSILLIGAPDGNLEVELPKGNSPDQIIFLSVFAGGGGPNQITPAAEIGVVDATIQNFVTDPKDPRFGLPLTYSLRRVDATSPAFTRPVHWSRVIHIAEGLLDNDVFGTPALMDVWNRFDDLDKVTGGGAEAFYQRANKGINLNLDKDVEMQPEDAKRLTSEVEDYVHGLTRVLKTRAMTIQELGSDVANFSAPAEAIIAQIAGAKGIPQRILMGSERGKLASVQDSDNWNMQVMDRRTSYAGPRIVRPFVDRLIEYGYLPTPAQYIVVWPEVSNLSETEKADGATKWATTNQTAGVTVFTPEEIRDHWYQMDPLTPDQLDKAKAQKEAEAPPPPVLPPGMGGKSGDGSSGKGGGPNDNPPGNVLPFQKRAAEALDDFVDVLEAAIEGNNTEVIDELLGVDRTLGSALSGNRGHAGRPGQRGGSLPRGGGPPAAKVAAPPSTTTTVVTPPVAPPVPPTPPVPPVTPPVVIVAPKVTPPTDPTQIPKIQGDPSQTAPMSFRKVFNAGTEFVSHGHDQEKYNKAVAAVSDETDRMMAEYPQLASLVGDRANMKLKVHGGQFVRGKRGGEWNGLFHWDRQNPSELSVSTDRAFTGPLVLAQNHKYNGYSVSQHAGMLATFRHELGHAAHIQYMNPSQQAEWANIWATTPKNSIPKSITWYAKKNQKELFAESFSAYTHPDYNNTMLTPKIRGFMEKHIGVRRAR